MAKSRDKPPHPNRMRHALDDTVHSLEDLLRNELAAPDADTGPAPAATRPAAGARRRRAPPSAADAPVPAEGLQQELPNLDPNVPGYDDIPVLHDAIEPGDPTPAPAATGSAAARQIAVRAVARLNIELRRAGRAPLEPATVDRLASILRDVLAEAAPNMDNKPDQ